MGKTTVDNPAGGLRLTMPACDQCGAPTPILVVGLCEPCLEAKLPTPVEEAMLAHAAEAKGAQSKARREARAS